MAVIFTVIWKYTLLRLKTIGDKKDCSVVVEVIKFVGERGLAFRGSDELVELQHNRSYSGILKLISQFDPLWQDTQTNGQKGRGSILSSASTQRWEQVFRNFDIHVN